MSAAVRRYSPVFFFNDTATTEIYTLSLHDALPILPEKAPPEGGDGVVVRVLVGGDEAERHRIVGRPLQLAAGEHAGGIDRKSTRLNSSHANISYAVFCFKKTHSVHVFSRPGQSHAS